MNRNARRASIILGVFMAVVLVGSTFLQLLSPGTTTTQTTPPTQRIDPTFPPPLDSASLTFDALYLHPSGIFAVPQPAGFVPSQPSSQLNVAQINMVNQEALAVIDAFVQNPATPINGDTLDTYFTAEVLDQTWSNFQNWTENSRRRDGDDLVIDFSVRFQNQNYVARQRAWTDGEWIYAVRVLAPENATNFLIAALDGVSAGMVPLKQFAGQPFNWVLTFDPISRVGIRHPQDWAVTDSAPGRPASIDGSQGETLRFETQAGNVTDEAGAAAWLETSRPGASVLSIVPITGAYSGFRVAYSTTTVDGDPQSGLAALINVTADTLAVANLRFDGESVDLNAISAQAQQVAEATPEAESTPEPISAEQAYHEQLALILSSLSVLPPLNLSADSVPPTATPRPTSTTAPTAEATADGTAEATEAATVEAEAATAEPEATAEATAAS
jgi:hypothetical protein